MLLALVMQACKKENSASSVSPVDRPQASIEIDGEQVSVTYNGDQVNNCETYSFAGSAGYYYGVSSIFNIDAKEDLRITFGTLRTDSSSLSEPAFQRLIKRGERRFGSLGAFNSYPGLDSDKVEIAFTDKKSIKWCSTEIKEVLAEHGIEAKVNINQPGGEFFIEDVERVNINGANGFRIKGNFKCFVYEVNGKGKKKMKGKFVGIVKMS